LRVSEAPPQGRKLPLIASKHPRGSRPAGAPSVIGGLGSDSGPRNFPQLRIFPSPAMTALAIIFCAAGIVILWFEVWPPFR
jgi:hypothetical protein